MFELEGQPYQPANKKLKCVFFKVLKYDFNGKSNFHDVGSTGIEAELISLGVQFLQYSLHLFTFLLPNDFWLFMTQILLQKNSFI